MRKIVVIIAVILMCVLPVFSSANLAYADNKQDIEVELENNIQSQLDKLDISGLESILKDLNEKQSGIFNSKSFIDKLTSILNGEFTDGASSVWQAILNLIFEEILDFLPLVATIVAVAILSGMIGDLRGGGSKSIANITHFVCYGVIIILIVNACTSILTLTSSTLQSLKTQIDVSFPILLTLLTSIGGTASVSIYQPAVALFSGTVMQIFTLVLMPLFIFSLVFAVISNLSSSVKLEKFSSFFTSLFKSFLLIG